MSHKIFSVYDSKSGYYCSPFFLKSTGEALRSFMDTASGKKDSMISQHPEDFTLFELGTYDEIKAVFEVYPSPRSLGVAIELISKG